MFKFIKNEIRINWQSWLGIASSIAGLAALNASILHMTHGAYNMIEILFV